MINILNIEASLVEILENLEEGNWGAASEEVQYLLSEMETEGPPEDLDYELTENQLLFIKEAQLQDLEINYTYSGRGMYGKQCPSVTVDSIGEFGTSAHVETDGMGRGYVIYARH